MREITAFPTLIIDQFLEHQPERYAFIPVVADSAQDATELLVTLHIAACLSCNNTPFDILAQARESLTMTLDADRPCHILAIQDLATGFLWFDNFGTVFGPAFHEPPRRR